MAHRKSYQWEPETPEEETQRKSRSQKKRESTALQDLGEEISNLPMRVIADLPLTPALLTAFRDLQKIPSHGAHRRQLQYIGRLMRELGDTSPLEEAPERYRDGLRKKTEATPPEN